MNLILIDRDEVSPDGTVWLDDNRAEHILDVLKAGPDRTVKTGFVDGPLGLSRIIAVDGRRVCLAPEHDRAAPSPWFDLLLAAPRPKALKRLWPQLAALGVGRVVVLNAFKVEKCYFSSQWLREAFYRPLLLEGLCQAGLTRLPEVLVRPRFKPFVEDELDALFPDSLRLLAHPEPARSALDLRARGRRPLLAVGPEGGWTDYERHALESRGFARFSLGSRTLRTDTACVSLIAVLAWWRTGTDGEDLSPSPLASCAGRDGVETTFR